MRFIAHRLQAPWRGPWLSNVAKSLSRRLRVQGDISLAVVPPGEMRRLNATYRGKDSATDVLSFSFMGGAPGSRRRPAATDSLAGEIVLCMPNVRKSARLNHRTILEEFQALTIHGTLHIIGYDHVRNSDAERMERLERRILDELAKR